VIDPVKWSDENNLPKKGGDTAQKNLKTKLQTLANDLETNLNEATSQGEEISGDWLKKQIDLILGRKKNTDDDRIINYIQLYMNNLPYKVKSGGRTGVAHNTIQKYTTLKKKITEFEKYRKKKFYVKDVGLKFSIELTKYFIEVDKLSINTAGRYIKYLKAVCNDAENNGIKAHPQLKQIKGVSEKASIVYLSREELDLIEQTSFSRDALINAKEWLIIGCYLGQRVSDLLVLTKKNIKVSKGLKIIELTQQKTRKKVAFPIHPKVEEYLELNNGNFPYPISDQKFNKHIKDVCRMAGIDKLVHGSKMLKDDDIDDYRKESGIYPKWELITTHVCRRSFATNFYGEMPTALLKSITGHSTEAQFLGYIGKTENDYAEQIAEFWVKEKQMAKKEPHLQVLKAAN
jgi:integrase